MTASAPILARLGLAQYVDKFIEHGFETWETVLDITESDLEALEVKLGHRRRLQREIASIRGFNQEKDLRSPVRTSPHEDGRHGGADDNPPFNTTDSKLPNGASGKRKYRRHPKVDENAPERPPSAYVIFSNKIREELRPQNLSFTDIAKRVGESWQILSPELKEPYESQASSAKEKYHAELAKYKKTDLFREHTEYLAEFKLKNASHADGKRPKLQKLPSTASSESAGSQHGLVGSFSSNTVVGRPRVGSVGSMETQSTSAPSGGHPSPDNFANVAPIATLGSLGSAFGTPTPASLSPSSSSVGGRELFHFGPGFQSSLENAEQSLENAQGQHLPRIVPLESRNTRALQGTASMSTDTVMIRDRSSPLMSFRQSNHGMPASLIQQDTASSKSSSRSSNLSSESSVPSSYKSVEDPMAQRSLPSLSTALKQYGEPGGQSRYASHSNRSASTYAHPPYSPFGSSSSGTFESLQLPLPYNISFQNDRPPPHDSPANTNCVAEDIPHERKSLKDLALTGISSDSGQELGSHSRDFSDAQRPQHQSMLQNGALAAQRLQTGRSTPDERPREGHQPPPERAPGPCPPNDDYRSEDFPISHSDPLSVLALAGRMVDQDAYLRSPKH